MLLYESRDTMRNKGIPLELPGMNWSTVTALLAPQNASL